MTSKPDSIESGFFIWAPSSALRSRFFLPQLFHPQKKSSTQVGARFAKIRFCYFYFYFLSNLSLGLSYCFSLLHFTKNYFAKKSFFTTFDPSKL